MTRGSRGTAPLSTQRCQQGSRWTSGTGCGSARPLRHSRMEMTSAPRWLPLLCPARLKPLTVPSLHSNLKCTQVSRCKIRAPSVPSTASPGEARVPPSWNLGEEWEEQEFGIPVGVRSVATEGKKKKDLHYFTANSASCYPAIRSESQVKQHGCLWTDRRTTEHASLESSVGAGAELKEGNSQRKKIAWKTNSYSLQMPTEHLYGRDGLKKNTNKKKKRGRESELRGSTSSTTTKLL